MNMFFCQCHRRIKADNRKIAGYVQDGLNDGFTYLRLGIIKLRGVVPREGCAIVAVVNVACIVGMTIIAFEDNRCILMIIVMIFKDDFYARIVVEVFRVEGVRRIWRIWQRQKPIGVFDDPVRVNAHVIGNHVS